MATNRNTIRQTQHKEKREDRKSKTVEEMKAENRRLRKQLSHAHKEINRLQNMVGGNSFEEEEQVVEEKKEEAAGQCCSNSNIISLPLRHGGVLRACKNCNHRKVDK